MRPLLKKLNNMSFRGTCHDLLRLYLTRRQYFTKTNGCMSGLTTVQVGVTQGSVLGPLQYLLYVQSLKYVNLIAKYFMFADDTLLVFFGNNRVRKNHKC